MADLEQQYAPSSVVGGSSAPWEAQYRRRSAAARDAVGERLVEMAGGSLLVEAGSPDAPLMIFIHGGYWQALSAAESLFPADDLLGLGWAYAALEYPLAPRTSIETMLGECASALARLAGSRRRRVVLVGHSAGAHLAAMLALAQRPPMQIDTLVLISGIYDLRPLVDTSINRALRLDLDGAASLSPLLLPAQAHPDVLVAWGEIETEAFVEQSRSFATHLRSRGSGVRELQCSARNHFDVVFDLGEPTSELGGAILDPSRARAE